MQTGTQQSATKAAAHRDSPAIDACDTFLYSPIHADYDLDGRGFDSATKPNVLGPFDRGADESPLLFASGFER